VIGNYVASCAASDSTYFKQELAAARLLFGKECVLDCKL
jgi:hypothetical protein